MYKIKFWGKVTDYSIWHGNQQLTTRYRLQTSSIRQKIAEDKNNGHDDLPCVDTCPALRYATMYSTGDGRGLEEGWNTDEDCRLTGKDYLVQRVEHRGISCWRGKAIWPNGWNTEEDCILTGKDFLAKRVEHWGGFRVDGKRPSDETGGTLRRISDWREKTIWPNGWNTERDCLLTGKDFLAKRVEHWEGLHIDGKRFSG